MPLVSVVLITYNGERYVERQLRSILEQSFSDFELIVSDDGSTDATLEIVSGFDDPRITIYCNSRRGVHRNLESGLRRAGGEYIALSDQDDAWKPDKLEKLLAALGENAAIFSDSAIIDSAGEPLADSLIELLKVRSPHVGRRFLRLLPDNCVSGHALLFRRELLPHITPFDDRFMYDQQIGIVAALHGGLAFTPEKLTLHRQHGGNQHNALLNSENGENGGSGSSRYQLRARHKRNELDAIAFALGKRPRHCSMLQRMQFRILRLMHSRMVAKAPGRRDWLLLLAVLSIANSYLGQKRTRRSILGRAFKYLRY